MRRSGWLLAVVVGCASCDRQILVGERDTPEAAPPAPAVEAGEAAPPPDATGLEGPEASSLDVVESAAPRDVLAVDGPETDGAVAQDSGLLPLGVPWSTGFEGAPGDTWAPNDPDCYATGGATFRIVTTPVHNGQHAAAFSVDSSLGSPSQTRCIEQGVLPPAAYYGAWYYVPAFATNTGNWNLLHFQGGDVADGTLAHGLWDVSLMSAPDGTLHAQVFDFLRMRVVQTTSTVPVGAWVHFEVYLVRSSGNAGEFTLRQDGQVVLDLTGLSTDDSAWGQWFVGNFATALSPSASTVYVDDVTIGLVSSG